MEYNKYYGVIYDRMKSEKENYINDTDTTDLSECDSIEKINKIKEDSYTEGFLNSFDNLWVNVYDKLPETDDIVFVHIGSQGYIGSGFYDEGWYDIDELPLEGVDMWFPCPPVD